MKKVTAILIIFVCIVNLNLAFAGSSKPGTDTQQSTSSEINKRPRFQR
jgi:preprotein translocase subunit SecG